VLEWQDMKYDKTFPWKNAHSFHRLTYHIVFTPKYRRRVLRGKLINRLRELFYECALVNHWFIHELEIMDDHVHLLIQISPTISLTKAIMYLKGGSSKVIRKEFPELEEFLWGDSLWQDGYYVETIGRLDEKAMREYIKNQKNQELSKSSSGL
jgi:putative transposase